MAKKQVLFIGDGVASTGFSTVLTNIIGNLDFRKIDAHHLAINYRGDPHPYKWSIYPAGIKGDLMGYNRVEDFAKSGSKLLSGIFILNDTWAIADYLRKIKEHFKENIPPIVVYFPVDAIDLDPVWFNDYDIVTTAVAYTEFGKTEALNANPSLESKLHVIPHGVDTKSFYKIADMTKEELREKMFPKNKLIHDGFIVLNANRNTPRKRIDLTVQGFSAFSQDKPKNVFLYLHMGIKDSGFDILKLSSRYGIANRLMITNTNRFIQSVPVPYLNQIYNISNVGLNTAWGEGFSLTNIEHGVTGAPQIVGDHSALHELYADCGVLVPVNRYLISPNTLTIGGYVHPNDVAMALEKIYTNRELYNDLSAKTVEKFTQEKYSWKYITKNQWMPLLTEAFKL